jgi:7-cyano-7-deazaguanine synthase
MQTQAVVLLSGGMDSVYNLDQACDQWPRQVQALFCDYGQRAAPAEKRACQFFCDTLSVPLRVLDLRPVFAGDRSSLTSPVVEVPTDAVDIEDAAASQSSAKAVWVANRNGVLLNVAACLAERLGASFVVPGFNAEEAQTFPDNSVDYIEKMNACLALSTANGVQIRCFSQALQKREIAQSLVEKGVAMEQIWSCYFDGDQPCGKCESCQRFLRAWHSTQKVKA